MVKRISDRYRPGEIPESWPGARQFFFDELWRIAQAMNAIPVSLAVEVIGANLPIGPAPPVEHNLFLGVPFSSDDPGGSWDQASGTWKCPVTGLYQINCTTTAAPFGAGNKVWQIDQELYINDVERYRVAGSGDDDFPVTNVMSLVGTLQREDVLRMMIEPTHDQFSGNTTADSLWTIGLLVPE